MAGLLKKEKYEPIRGLMDVGDDYHVYKMKVADRVVAAAAGVVAGIAVGYVFFNSIPAAIVIGVILALVLQMPYREILKKKRSKDLLLQFRDLLEAISASYSSGQTTIQAFADAESEMTTMYGENSDITREVNIINTGLANGYRIEDLLINFAERSGLDDVESFANVFEVCNRKGGDLKKIVSDTRGVICDKIGIELEIETMVASAKNELNIMMVFPFVIMLCMRGLGDNMTDNSLTNLIVKCVALVIFIAAYLLGRKMTDIKL